MSSTPATPKKTGTLPVAGRDVQERTNEIGIGHPRAQWLRNRWQGGHRRCAAEPTHISSAAQRFNHFVTSIVAPVDSDWSISPGGACTHWKAPTLFGAHQKEAIGSFLRVVGSAGHVIVARFAFESVLFETPGGRVGGDWTRRLRTPLYGGRAS